MDKKMPASQRLSACLIVRDEEARLPRCLRSLRHAVDELVVVDTGSRDRSIEIAHRAGARVESFCWCDDFAAARNRSLELATGEWILSVDADEWLVEDAGTRIRRAIGSPGVLAWRLGLLNLLDSGRQEEEHLTRLFQKRRDLRWRGRVHEQITQDLHAILSRESLCWGEIPGICLLHDGYQGQAMRDADKRARNLRLLRAELEREPGDLYLRERLAAELGDSGWPHLAQVLDGLVPMAPEHLLELPWARNALINGAWRASQRGDLARARATLSVARELYGEHPMLGLVAARLLVHQGEPERALVLLEQLRESSRSWSGLDRTALLLELSLCEARALLAEGRESEALPRLHELYERHSYAASPLHGILRLLLESGNQLAALRMGVEHLRRSPQDTICLEFCAQAADGLGRHEAASRWRARLLSPESPTPNPCGAESGR